MDEPELSLGLETVKNAVDSSMEALSHQSSSWYKLPAVSVPRVKAGGDWRCFVSDFKDMMRLADLKLSHQLTHLKLAMPEEPKCLLYQSQVETVESGTR